MINLFFLLINFEQVVLDLAVPKINTYRVVIIVFQNVLFLVDIFEMA